MKLVPDWKEAGRWWSVRLTALFASIGPIWMALPPEVQQMAKDMIPTEWLPWVTPIVLVIALARVIDQGPTE